MSGTLFLILAAIVALVGGMAARRRTKRVRGGAPVVGDDMLRSILDEDALRALEEDDPLDDGEPLDEDEIRKAEDEFWEEGWDDSEGWRS